jgi:hypothetical protein
MSVTQCIMNRRYNFLLNVCIGVSENKLLKCVSVLMSHRGCKPNTTW